jgi:preprotein translocase subunit YajC
LNNNILYILLDGQGGNLSFLLTMGAVFLVMYFFMMRPQQKKQKDQKKFLEEMKKGDSVVTIGGLHGKIHELDDLTVVLEVDRGFRLKFDRSSISMEASNRAKKEAETPA